MLVDKSAQSPPLEPGLYGKNRRSGPSDKSRPVGVLNQLISKV